MLGFGPHVFAFLACSSNDFTQPLTCRGSDTANPLAEAVNHHFGALHHWIARSRLRVS
jgi:hypothetical protein